MSFCPDHSVAVSEKLMLSDVASDNRSTFYEDFYRGGKPHDLRMILPACADAAAKATSGALSIPSETPSPAPLPPHQFAGWNRPRASSAVNPSKLRSTTTEREMMWNEAFPQPQCADGEQEQPPGEESHLNFDFFSLVSKPKVKFSDVARNCFGMRFRRCARLNLSVAFSLFLAVGLLQDIRSGL